MQLRQLSEQRVESQFWHNLENFLKSSVHLAPSCYREEYLYLHAEYHTDWIKLIKKPVYMARRGRLWHIRCHYLICCLVKSDSRHCQSVDSGVVSSWWTCSVEQGRPQWWDDKTIKIVSCSCYSVITILSYTGMYYSVGAQLEYHKWALHRIKLYTRWAKRSWRYKLQKQNCSKICHLTTQIHEIWQNHSKQRKKTKLFLILAMWEIT